MFDISFFELAVIGAVALVVIGPERLPHVARTVGRWIGKIQRYVSDVKADINREMELEELRRLRAEMNETARSVEATARSMERTLRDQAVAAEGAANELAAEIKSPVAADGQGSKPGNPAVLDPIADEPAATTPGLASAASQPVAQVSAEPLSSPVATPAGAATEPSRVIQPSAVAEPAAAATEPSSAEPKPMAGTTSPVSSNS